MITCSLTMCTYALYTPIFLAFFPHPIRYIRLLTHFVQPPLLLLYSFSSALFRGIHVVLRAQICVLFKIVIRFNMFRQLGISNNKEQPLPQPTLIFADVMSPIILHVFTSLLPVQGFENLVFIVKTAAVL